MSVIDKFLDAMRLNSDEDYDDNNSTEIPITIYLEEENGVTKAYGYVLDK